MSRSGPAPGDRSGSSHARGAVRGSTATPSGTGRGARSASGTRSGVRDPLDRAGDGRGPRSAFVGRHDFSAFGGDGPTTGPDPPRGPGPQEGSLVTIDVRATPSCARWCEASWPPSCAVGHGKMRPWQVWSRAAVAGPGLRRSRSPRRRGCVSGGSSSGDGTRRIRIGEGTRMMTQDVHAAGERDRAPVVRRRRDGETLGRLATRIATLLAGKHKPTYATHMDTGDHVIVLNAGKIDRHRRQAATKSYPATAATRAASSRRRWATCSRGDRRRSSAARSRACCRTTAWASSSCASSRSTPGSEHPA